MNCTIRPAHPSDAYNLTALSIQVWLNTYANQGLRDVLSHYALEHFTPAYFTRQIENGSKHLLLAEQDSHLLGYIQIACESSCPVDERLRLEIVTLYVQNQAHGRGIGAALLKAARELAMARGDAALWTSVWLRNQSGLDFYRHQGLIQVGNTEFLMNGESHNNQVMAWRAGAGSSLGID